MEFKDRIKSVRIERGMTLTELGSLFQKSESACRAWELGRTKPDADTLILLARHFECSVDYLLGLSKYRNPCDALEVEETKSALLASIQQLSNSPLDDKKIYSSLSQVFFALGKCSESVKERLLFCVEDMIVTVASVCNIASYASHFSSSLSTTSEVEKEILGDFVKYKDSIFSFELMGIDAIRWLCDLTQSLINEEYTKATGNPIPEKKRPRLEIVPLGDFYAQKEE